MERCDLGRFAWAGTVASFAATVGIVSAFLLAQSDPPCTSCNPASRACFRPFNSPLLHTAPLMTYPSSQAGEHAEHALATCIASMARSLAMVVRNSPNEGKFKTEAVELVEKIQQTIQISELENDPSLDLYHDAPVLPYPSTPANETKDGHDIIDVLARSMHRVARSMSLKARPKSNGPAHSKGLSAAKVGDAAEDEILEVSDDEILEVSDDEVIHANVSWSDVMDVDILGSDE